jgi:anti-anti-sigma regulatory factor
VAESAEFPVLQPALVEDLRFRRATPSQLAAIKERMRNISRGGVVVPTPDPPAPDAVAEVRYRTQPNGQLLEGVGLVREIKGEPPAASIQFLRVGPAARGARPSGRRTAAKPATKVYTDGPTLIVVGEFGSASYHGFVSCWARTLEDPSDNLIIDLTGVTRISSMGVGLLVGAHMDCIKHGKSLTIKVPVAFQRLLAVSGMDKVVRFVYVDNRPGDGREAEMIGTATAEAEAVRGDEEALDLGGPQDPVAEAEDELQRELERVRREQGGSAGG